VSERAPVLGRSRFQAAERADGALAWTLGSLHRLDQQVVGVGFPVVEAGSFANVHWPLHVASAAITVDINLNTFSHYFQKITTPPMKRNELDKNLVVFFRNSQEQYGSRVSLVHRRHPKPRHAQNPRTIAARSHRSSLVVSASRENTVQFRMTKWIALRQQRSAQAVDIREVSMTEVSSDSVNDRIRSIELAAYWSAYDMERLLLLFTENVV